jgi:hypothetical protein
MPSWIAALATGVLLPAAGLGAAVSAATPPAQDRSTRRSDPSQPSVANRTGLVAISPANPWTLRELERSHAAIVGHDPETGVSWVVANAAEERRLVELGFTGFDRRSRHRQGADQHFRTARSRALPHL